MKNISIVMAFTFLFGRSYQSISRFPSSSDVNLSIQEKRQSLADNCIEYLKKFYDGEISTFRDDEKIDSKLINFLTKIKNRKPEYRIEDINPDDLNNGAQWLIERGATRFISRFYEELEYTFQNFDIEIVDFYQDLLFSNKEKFTEKIASLSSAQVDDLVKLVLTNRQNLEWRLNSLSGRIFFKRAGQAKYDENELAIKILEHFSKEYHITKDARGRYIYILPFDKNQMKNFKMISEDEVEDEIPLTKEGYLNGIKLLKSYLDIINAHQSLWLLNPEHGGVERKELKFITRDVIKRLSAPEFKQYYQEQTFFLGEEISDKTIIKSYKALISTQDITFLSDPFIQYLLKIANKELPEDLLDPEVQRQIYKNLRDRMLPTILDFNLGEIATNLKDIIRFNTRTDEDRKDMLRGYGYKFFSEDDKIFQDPLYLSNLLKYSQQEYVQMNHPVLKDFQEAFKKLSPDSKPFLYTNTGSDAVNYIWNIALANYRRKDNSVKEVDILFFDSVYGAGRGKAAAMGFHNIGRRQAEKLSGLDIKSPVYNEFNPKNVDQSILDQEQEILLGIKEKIANAEPTKPIGGIFIEPIVGAGGVQFFRTDFLLELQKICEENQIPIFADEVLTGGGRTGKFWGYENYLGFKPDFVIFGKGLQVAGIAAVSKIRESGFRQFNNAFSDAEAVVTSEVPVESLLKSIQVLNKINEENLLEKITENGQYLLEKLKEKDSNARGIGYLLHGEKGIEYKSALSGRSEQTSGKRIMPSFSLTREDIDELFDR